MTDRADRVGLVTGASRGAGAGTRALGSYGMTVYVTGRAEVTGEAEDGMDRNCRVPSTQPLRR